MTKIYLSGGIAGIDYKLASSWREEAKAYFEFYGYDVINPLRGHYYQGKPEKLLESDELTINEIVRRDLYDLKRSDLVFVEFTNPFKNYIGTVTEVALASFIYNIPVIVWAGNEERVKDLENGWMGFMAAKIIGDFSEALEYTVNYLADR